MLNPRVLPSLLVLLVLLVLPVLPDHLVLLVLPGPTKGQGLDESPSLNPNRNPSRKSSRNKNPNPSLNGVPVRINRAVL